MNTTALVLTKRVAAKILILRNRRVILDSDLAELYGVPIKRLNEQIQQETDRDKVLKLSQELIRLLDGENDKQRDGGLK